ncbi:MAG: hypothetical protein K8S25_16410, partial [Alphaproteobacteria bacterium]|nr:hypothetical protein [Alphaproteobacteria bacterium]
QWPSLARMTAPADWATGRCWFRNLDARYPFGFEPGQRGGCGDPAVLGKVQALDFSLQLAIGLRNWSLAHAGRTRLGTIALRGDELTVNGEVSLPLRR